MIRQLEQEASAEAQAIRRARVFARIGEAVRPCFLETEGRLNLQMEAQTGESRATLWLANAFFHTGEGDFANRILADLAWTPEFHYNSHFCGVACMVLLSRHRERLSPPVRQKLEDYVLRYLPDWMTLDFRIHGANDNAGIECASVVAWAGSYFNNPGLLAFAKDRFALLFRTLRSNEYIHECNSPTYSGVSLGTLAELQECSPDSEIRRLARQLETQVWTEVLTHFHPVLRHQIGPFSRSYADDNAMQLSLVMMVMACALGEVSPVRPETMLFPPPAGTFAHSSWPFQWASLACLASPTYHPPVGLLARTLRRAFPYEVGGRNEYSPMGVAPGGSSQVHAHVEKNWSLSWFSNRPLCGAPVHLMYARRPVTPEQETGDYLRAVRAVTTRCRVDERMANFRLREAADDLVAPDNGVAFCAGRGGTVVLGYVPVHNRTTVRTISASAVFPLHFSQPDEVWHGAQRLPGFAGSYGETDWAFIRDGAVFLGIRPLVAACRDVQFARQQYGQWGGFGAVTVFSCASFAHHTLSQRELQTLGTGLVLEVSTAEEESFAEFRERIAQAKIEDTQWGPQREIHYSRPGVEVELLYDVQFLSLRRASARRTG